MLELFMSLESYFSVLCMFYGLMVFVSGLTQSIRASISLNTLKWKLAIWEHASVTMLSYDHENLNVKVSYVVNN